MTGLVYLSFGGFPAGYCYPGDPDTFAEDLIALTSVNFNVTTGNLYYNFGPNTPAVDKRVYPWLRTGDAANPEEEGWYYWNAGAGVWTKPHPVAPSSGERRWVEMTEDAAGVWGYDGGDGDDPSVVAPTLYTGAMWEVDHNYDFRFPLGAGTSPKPTTVAVGDTGGSEEVILTFDQVQHFHGSGVFDTGDANAIVKRIWNLPVGNIDLFEQDWTDAPTSTTTISITGGTLGTTDPLDSGTASDAHDNMPPYRVGFWIKRTARVYYTQT